MSGIIFISGVHGVGKTTFCKMLVEELEIQHFSASNLITNFSKIEFPADKHIKDISYNQPILVEAVRQYVPKNKSSILDGHFCLIDTEGAIENIAENIFFSLGIIAIICLKCDAQEISKRLSNRDGFDHDVEFISHLQNNESERSKYISDEINVPYFSITTPLNNTTKTELLNKLKELI